MNNSSTTSDYARHEPRDVISKMQEALLAEGVVMVWGAGNDGGDGSAVQTNPWGQTPTAGSISVGAYDDHDDGRRDGETAFFSARGLDGDPVTYPDLVAPGAGIRTACRANYVLCGVDSQSFDTDVGAASGTSFSALFVTGAVALLLQADPELAPPAVERLLEDTAHPFGAKIEEQDPANPSTPTSFDRRHGLLDATAAVAAPLGAADEGPRACLAGRVAIDGAGDVTALAFGDAPLADRRLDLRRLDLAVVGEALQFTVGLTELDGERPATSPRGYDLDVSLDADGVPLVVDVLHVDEDEPIATLEGPLADVPLEVRTHPDRAVVVVDVPLTALVEAGGTELGRGSRLASFQVTTRRDLDLLALAADRSYGHCAVEVPTRPRPSPSGEPEASTHPEPSAAPEAADERSSEPASPEERDAPTGAPSPSTGPSPDPTSDPSAPSSPPTTPRTLTVTELSGADRIATAIAVSRHVHADREGRIAVLVRADDYPEALVGAPLARLLGGPLLLTGSDHLDERVAAELRRLGTEEVVLLGGRRALTDHVHQDVEGLGAAVRRVAGPERFATAARVAEELDALRRAAGVTQPATVYVAQGIDEDPQRGWPDALAVAGLAALEARAVLLTTRTALPSATRAALERPGGTSATIVGGTAAVGADVADELAQLVEVARLGGATRYATSALLADRALIAGAREDAVWLATGTGYADGLVAGAAAAAAGAPLLLVDGHDPDGGNASRAWLNAHAGALSSVVWVGGRAAVGREVRAVVEAALR